MGRHEFRPSPSRPIGWRGDSTGRYPGADPVTAWDVERGTNVLWRTPLRQFSCATPVVVGDRLFTTLEPRALLCQDKMTGKLLWTNDASADGPVRDLDRLSELLMPETDDAATEETEKPWSERKLDYGDWAGSSMPTPVTDGRHIWVKNGGFAACFALEGNRQWTTQTHLAATDHPMNVPSPVLIDGVLVCEGGISPYWEKHSGNKLPEGVLPRDIPGKTGSYKFKHWIVGLDAATGKLLWDIGPLHGGGYGGPSSPVGLTLSRGAECMGVVVTGEGHVVRAADGKLLVPYAGTRCNFASPAAFDGKILFANHGGLSMLGLEMVSRDKVRAEVVWKARAGTTWSAPVLREGLIYVDSLEGRRIKVPVVSVHDATTGERIYRQELPFSIPAGTWDCPSDASAGRYVFLFTARNAAVFEPGPRPWLLAVNRFERMHANPTFDGDRLYLRTFDAVMCIGRTGEAGRRYERQVRARTLLAQFPDRLARRKLVDPGPAVDFKPAAGTPVSDLARTAYPDRWIFAGPLPMRDGTDALESIGGCANARPGRRTKVVFGDLSRTFEPLPRSAITPDGLDVMQAVGDERNVQCFYYTVVEAAEAKTCAFELDPSSARAWLGGQAVQDGQAVRLAAGRYPLLVRATVVRDEDASAPSTLKVGLHPSLPPEEELQRNRAFVCEHAAVLRHVIELDPDGPEGRRAAELLAQVRE